MDSEWLRVLTRVMMSVVNLASQSKPRTRTAAVPSAQRREQPSSSSVPESPAATTAPRRTWKDPRLLVGIAIVAVSVLAGARMFAQADDTVPVWSVAREIPAGTSLTTQDLRREDVRFSSPELAARYVSARAPLPEGLVLTHEVATGELLPRAALSRDEAPRLLEVPVVLAGEAVPAGLRAGELVDVWVTPAEQSGPTPRALRVLEQVRVVAAPRTGTALGPSATRQVVVGLPESLEHRLGPALAALSDGTAVVIRRG